MKDKYGSYTPRAVSITIGATQDFALYVTNAHNIFVIAKYDLGSQKWGSIQNFAASEFEKEQNEKAALEAQAREVAQEAQALNNRRQSAITDCGVAPNLSGAPWFSSTYEVAVKDAIARSGFYCVKTAEYVSAAPNLFGGKAARVRFTGYRKGDFQPATAVLDLPY